MSVCSLWCVLKPRGSWAREPHSLQQTLGCQGCTSCIGTMSSMPHHRVREHAEPLHLHHWFAFSARQLNNKPYQCTCGHTVTFCKTLCSNAFEDSFVGTLKLCHKLETNKLRNIGKLYAHLLGTAAVSWAVLSEVVITEERTTSASRIFIKFLFQVRLLSSWARDAIRAAGKA
jgi:hypothetical protein